MPQELDPTWLEELSEWLRIPSVSADAAHAEDVARSGEWVRDFVRAAGGRAELVPTDALPLAVGEIAASNGADACLIFDSGMPRLDTPAFDLAVRGLVYFHVRVRTGERDLHSGVYGGAAMNGVHALMQALAPP